MKKHNVQTIKHVIGVLAAEGGGNEVIEHCISELAAMIGNDQLKGYVKLLARQTAQELRPKVEAVDNAVHRVPRMTTELVIDGPAPDFPDQSDLSVQSDKSDRTAAGFLAEELRHFLKGRENCGEREIISAIFSKFHCKNTELAKVLNIRPNLIAKVKTGLNSPTVAAALKKFTEGK
ncbi:MAG: hypothetical protein V8T90_05370 [Victivallales bacterium]